MISRVGVDELQLQAARTRRLVIRMLAASHAGHLGGALSALDIMTVLYHGFLRGDPNAPRWLERDRFVLSAGHKGMALYAVLASKGYFPEEILDSYGSYDSPIPGHPDMHKLPGVEANTGALGHGLSLAVGMALGARIEGRDSRTYVLLGDGELAEGSNWEAAAAAAHHRLGTVAAFVDANGLQISGPTSEVMNMEPIADKFAAFGWATSEIDGNDIGQIIGALENIDVSSGKPTAIVAHTVKSRGLSFAEGDIAYHYWKPTSEDISRAESELELRIELLSGVRR